MVQLGCRESFAGTLLGSVRVWGLDGFTGLPRLYTDLPGFDEVRSRFMVLSFRFGGFR
jgi:hypothetical protein